MGGGSKVLSEYFLNYQLKMSIPKGSFRLAKLGPLHYMAVLTEVHIAQLAYQRDACLSC